MEESETLLSLAVLHGESERSCAPFHLFSGLRPHTSATRDARRQLSITDVPSIRFFARAQAVMCLQPLEHFSLARWHFSLGIWLTRTYGTALCKAIIADAPLQYTGMYNVMGVRGTPHGEEPDMRRKREGENPKQQPRGFTRRRLFVQFVPSRSSTSTSHYEAGNPRENSRLGSPPSRRNLTRVTLSAPGSGATATTDKHTTLHRGCKAVVRLDIRGP